MASENTPSINGLDRRALLRATLLAGLGATAVGGASALLTGTASAAQPAAATPPSGSSQQFDWGWCNACAGLFYLHNGNYSGVCPAKGANGIDSQPHALVKNVEYGSFDYGIYYDGSGTDWQSNWCYCGNCKGLFHHGSGSKPNGICPYGKGNLNYGHVNSGYSYIVYYGSVSGSGQPYWYWCSNCSGMFYAGTGETRGGACPAGGSHDGSSSYPYQLSNSGSLSLGPTPAPTGIAGNWTLAFDDEFSNTSLDTTRWVALDNYAVNGVKTCLSSPANVTVSGGQLALTLASATSGAWISSDPADGAGANGWTLPVGGCVEARVNFPGPDSGHLYNWPGFWVSGPDWPAGGEEDICEGLDEPSCTYHYSSGGSNQSIGPDYPSTSVSNGFHTFGLLRGSSTCTYYWDGVQVFSVTTDDSGASQSVLLSVGSGNSAPAAYGIANAVLVDYVRGWIPS